MRSRAAAVAIAAVVLLAVAGVLVSAASKSTHLVFSTAVNPVSPVAPIEPGATLCQRTLGVTESFDRVRFNAGTFGRPGPPLFVSVSDESSGAELGSGEQVPGWVDNGAPRNVTVGSVQARGTVAVCIRNLGRVPAYVYGDYYHGAFGKGPLGVTPTNSTTVADIDGVQLEGDTAMWLYDSHAHSTLAWIPALFRHAAAFKPPFVGAWTFWLLAALLLIGAPLALWAALRSALRSDEPSLPSSRRP